MAETARGPIRKFNPGTLQSDREIVEQFVVRLRELDIVLEVLNGNVASASSQHLLMVAPRGRGKTMLLARTAAELRTNDALGRYLLPVRFMEESHEIFGMADFWLETLFHLAREIGASHHELADELRMTHQELCGRWGERDLSLYARAAVLETADRIDRKLVLMVENLQALRANVDEDFGWQLRAALQSEPQIMLVATATTRFDGLDDAGEPFFELFRTLDLKPLTTEECRCLWEAVSGDTTGARDMRPLEILTGGNPRLLTIVAGFSEHRSLRQLMQELVSLIDDHTEYFRGHLEVLPKGERRVYVAVLDLWQASSASEIAARARMGVRMVATLLGRLVERGAVAVHPAGRKRRLYSASEPLYSIYYKLRRERDEATVVESLIRFMVAFYHRSVLHHIFDRMWSEARRSPSLHAGIDRALAHRPTDEPDLGIRFLWDRLREVSDKAWDRRHTDALITLEEKTRAAFQRQDFGQVIKLVGGYSAEDWQSRSESSELTDRAYLANLTAQAYLGMGEYEKVIAVGNEMHDEFRFTRDAFILYRTMEVLCCRIAAHHQLGEHGNVIGCVDDLLARSRNIDERRMQKNVAWALNLAAEAEERVGNLKRAHELSADVLNRLRETEAPELQVHLADAMLMQANMFSTYDNNHETAMKIYDRVIERWGESRSREIESRVVGAFLNRSVALSELDDFEGELTSYDEIIERSSRESPWEAVSMAGLACALKAMRLAVMGRVDEAQAACDEIDRRLESLAEEREFWLASMSRGARAVALMTSGDGGAAIDCLRSALAVCPTENTTAIKGMIGLVRNLISAGAEERDLMHVLLGDKDKARRFEPLVLALRMRIGEKVRAPAELTEVAADLCKRLASESVKGLPWDI